MRCLSLLLSVGVCVALLIGQVAVAQSYTITDLGILPGGSYSIGNGINQSGEVTGWADTNTGALHAFLFSNGTMQDLGTLPGGGRSGGTGINASGQVTGWSETSDAPNVYAFLFSNGTMQDLGTLPGGVASFGRAINDSGQVTGNSVGASPDHAFLFSNGTMYDLGTPPGFFASIGYGINELGEVTGEAYSGTGYYHAFLFSGGSMSDLGTLPGGTYSSGRAINQSGQLTGMSGTSDGKYHAFLFSNGTMQDLGTLPGGTYSTGYAINQSGQVTGYADDSTGGGAALFSNGTVQNLNDLIPPNSGWTLVVGNGINDRGQITGLGTLNGSDHAFLLTPVVSDTTPPVVTLKASPIVLWPADRRMVTVTVSGTITDAGSGMLASSVEYAVNDEYQVIQPRGHLTLDSAGIYAFTLSLRASREDFDSNGRVYMIRVSARDNAGNRGAKWQAVTVPHDRR